MKRLAQYWVFKDVFCLLTLQMSHIEITFEQQVTLAALILPIFAQT